MPKIPMRMFLHKQSPLNYKEISDSIKKTFLLIFWVDNQLVLNFSNKMNRFCHYRCENN